MRRWLFLAVALTVAALGFAACEDEEAEPAAPGPQSGAVGVVLSEFSITPDVSTVKAGSVTFEAKNEGSESHELVVVKTDVAADALPVSAGKADEEAAGEVIGEIEPEDLPGGGEAEATFDLEPGRYLLICNIAGHYEQGMYAELTVE